MTRLTFLLIPVLVGLTSRYAIGVFPATVAVRVEHGTITPAQVATHDGFAAVVDCALIGSTIYALPNGGLHVATGEPVAGQEWRRLLIADCARRDGADGARDWMLDGGILIEIDGELAQQYGYDYLGPLPVVVSTQPPLFGAQ